MGLDEAMNERLPVAKKVIIDFQSPMDISRLHKLNNSNFETL